MQKMNRIIDLVSYMAAALAGILIVFLMISICLGVIMRLAGKPIPWVIELNEYALLYIAFLAGAWVLRQDSHVKVDILLTTVPPRVRAWMNLLNSAIGLVIAVIITVYGAKVSLDLFARGVYNPTLLSFPKGPLVAVIPIGFFLLSTQFLRMLLACWAEVTASLAGAKGISGLTEVQSSLKTDM